MMLVWAKTLRPVSLHFVLQAGVTQSRLKIQRRIKEKKLAEEMEELKDKPASKTAKRLAVMEKTMGAKVKIQEVIPQGYRLGILAEEAAQANPDVAAALSLTNGCPSEWMKLRRTELAAEFGRDKLDTGNSAVQIAFTTERIIALSLHMRKYRNDTSVFLKVKHLLDNRRKMLKYLHRSNYYLYQAVVAKYQLKDTPGDHHFQRMRRRMPKLS